MLSPISAGHPGTTCPQESPRPPRTSCKVVLAEPGASMSVSPSRSQPQLQGVHFLGEVVIKTDLERERERLGVSEAWNTDPGMKRTKWEKRFCLVDFSLKLKKQSDRGYLSHWSECVFWLGQLLLCIRGCSAVLEVFWFLLRAHKPLQKVPACVPGHTSSSHLQREWV